MGTAYEDIATLIFTYAERIDDGDFVGVADLFAHAEITFEGFSGVRRGRDQVRAMYEATTRRYQDGTPRTKHLTTNVIVDADETRGTATARSYFAVLQAVPGQLALQPIVAGRYQDRFERVDGAWRFAGRHMLLDLAGDLGHHMLGELRPDG